MCVPLMKRCLSFELVLSIPAMHSPPCGGAAAEATRASRGRGGAGSCLRGRAAAHLVLQRVVVQLQGREPVVPALLVLREAAPDRGGGGFVLSQHQGCGSGSAAWGWGHHPRGGCRAPRARRRGTLPPRAQCRCRPGPP